MQQQPEAISSRRQTWNWADVPLSGEEKLLTVDGEDLT